MSTLKSNRFHSFGLALKETLNKAGVTPAWLARTTGKDKGQISKYLNDKILPKRITRLELTSPIGYDIIEVEGEWEVHKQSGFVNKVEEIKVDYSVEDFSNEKQNLESVFSEIQGLNKLFNEMLLNDKLSEKEKKIQLEMIKQKLVLLIRSIPYTTN